MPNLLSDNLGVTLRGQVVRGEALPDQQVSVDFNGAIIPTQSSNEQSYAAVQDALEQLALLNTEILTIKARLTAAGIP